MKNIIAIIIILAIVLAGVILISRQEPTEKLAEFAISGNLDENQETLGINDSLYLGETTMATIHTSKGDIEVKLFEDSAPKHVENFKKLAQEGFYNGLTFHRREEGFVIQGGDPEGNGSGGPGYTIPAEIKELHTRGALAAARLPDVINPEQESSGSQFYIALDDLPMLDGDYTVFGQVTKGMEVVDQIQIGDTIDSVDLL